MNNFIILVFIFIALISRSGLAYVYSKSEVGGNLKWNLRDNTINLFINTESNGDRSYNLDDKNIKTIISESVEQWSEQNIITINPLFTTNLPSIGVGATLRFTDNTAYFGSGVLAVTSIGHDPKTGNIFSADILVNESISNNTLFTNTPMLSSGTDYAYLGDVITHEIGHLLGLAHSESVGSTMLYSIFKGQYDVAADDISGLKSLYRDSYQNRYKGRVVGGNQIPIFGAHVQMILHSTGEVFASQMTNEKGEFFFDDPPFNDYFVLYISPPKSLNNLPSYYSTATTDYCSGSYRPAFFSKCGGRSKGRPQLFSTSYVYEDLLDDTVAANQYDLGAITIRCNDNIDPQYIYSKYNSSAMFELFSFDQYYYQWNQSAGEIFVGTFSETELQKGQSGKGDVFEVDYTGFENPSGHYMDLRISTETIGSMLKLTVIVKRISDGQTTTYTTNTDPITGKNLLNHSIKHLLSTSPENNRYEITIKPVDSSSFTEEDQEEILAIPAVMKNKENHYLLMLTLGKYEDSSYKVFAPKQYQFPEDNAYCSEGNPVYTSQANISGVKSNGAQSQEQNSPISCGTIEIDNDSGPNSGPMSFILGLSLILFMAHIRQSLLKVLSN